MADTMAAFEQELERSKQRFLTRMRNWAAGEQFPEKFTDAFEQALRLRQEGILGTGLFDKIFSDTHRLLNARYVARHDRSPRGDDQKRLEAEARHEAREYVREELAKEFAKWTGEQLRIRAEAELSLLEFTAQEIPRKLRLIEQVLAQIDKVREYEFIQGLMSCKALACTPDTGPLKSIAREMAVHRAEVESALTEFRSRSDRPLSARSDAELKACIKAATALHQQYLPAFERLSRATEAAVNALDFTVNDKMLDAYIRSTSPKIGKIKAAKLAVDSGIGLTGALLNKTNATGFFVRLSRLLSSVAFTSATQTAIAIDKDTFLHEDVRTRLFPRYNENPALLAADLQAKQRAALEILLNALDATVSGALLAAPEPVGSTVMEVVDPIVEAVKDAVESVLDKRMELAVAEIERIRGPVVETKSLAAQGEDALWTRAAAICQGACRKVSADLEEFEEAIGFKVSEIWTAHALAEGLKNAEHESVLGSLIELIAPRVTRIVLQYADISPAEILTGHQLAALLDEIHFSQAPVGMEFVREVQRPAPTPIGGAAQVPEKVSGRNVLRSNASRSVLGGARPSYCISLDFDGVEVWGQYTPGNRSWRATEVDQASFTNWQDIQVFSDAIETGADGSENRLEGSWLWVDVPELKVAYIAFAPADGSPLRWGHRGDTSGARGRNYQLQNLVPEKLRVRKGLEDIYRA